MAYQKKYYFQFIKLKTNQVHVVELWQNTEATITAQEVKTTLPPFVVEMPEIDNKFQVVRGTGCQINLLSETNFQFFNGLYHVEPTEFMVKHYIDDSINWLGYLNAEMITEPYDIDFNYQVSITGNDGFSLMDRFSFIQVSEENYTGIKSKWELLQIVFDKIGLPFTDLRVSLSTTFADFSGDTDKTILHESYIDCANFYDEDNKPMSLRQVVESILAPYAAFIRAEAGHIYISDIHTLASQSSITYKVFNYSTFAYSGFVAIPNVKAVSTIGYKGTGQNIEVSGGINRQVVVYSPYPFKSVIDNSLVTLDEFETIPASYSTKNGYFYKTLENNSNIEIDFAKQVSLNPTTFEASYYNATDENKANVYLRFPRYGGVNSVVAYTKTNPYISISSGVIGVLDNALRYPHFWIDAEILLKTKTNPYAPNDPFDSNQQDKGIKRFFLNCRLKVGTYYFNPSSYPFWSTTPSNFFIETRVEGVDIFDNRFVKLGIIDNSFSAVIGHLFTDPEFNIYGNVVFEIWSEFKSSRSTDLASITTNSTDIQEIWIKNLSINVRDGYGNELADNDVEYIGLLDKTFQNEGQKITLTTGTDIAYADKAKIMSKSGTNYTSIKGWTRAGQSFKIEELLLGSVSSNYRAGFVTLSNMKINNSISLNNVITDSYLGSKKLMIKSAMVNYHDNMIDCSLVEITPDELIIVK